MREARKVELKLIYIYMKMVSHYFDIQVVHVIQILSVLITTGHDPETPNIAFIIIY